MSGSPVERHELQLSQGTHDSLATSQEIKGLIFLTCLVDQVSWKDCRAFKAGGSAGTGAREREQ